PLIQLSEIKMVHQTPRYRRLRGWPRLRVHLRLWVQQRRGRRGIDMFTKHPAKRPFLVVQLNKEFFRDDVALSRTIPQIAGYHFPQDKLHICLTLPTNPGHWEYCRLKCTTFHVTFTSSQ